MKKVKLRRQLGMHNLEIEEAATQRNNQRKLKIPSSASTKKVQGIKILTPRQMLSRLTIILAQLQAVNNSQTLKNELRHLLYSLYC